MPILSEEDLERFRTKVCTLASSMKCDFGVERCNYSHNLYWARRCPFYLRDSSILRYIPACCPDVELGEGTTVLRNTCPRGNNCSFAHSYEEIHYHPLIYKTEVCKEYRLGKCKTYYCHLVHGLAEFRVPRQYVLPKKNDLNIPTYKYVTMVDNIRSFNGNHTLGHYQKERIKYNQKSEININEKGSGWASFKWNYNYLIPAKNRNDDINSSRNNSIETTKNISNLSDHIKATNDDDCYKYIDSSGFRSLSERNITTSESNKGHEWYKLLSLTEKPSYQQDVKDEFYEHMTHSIHNKDNDCNSSLLSDKHSSLISDDTSYYKNSQINESIHDNDSHVELNESKINPLVLRNIHIWKDSDISTLVEGSEIGYDDINLGRKITIENNDTDNTKCLPSNIKNNPNKIFTLDTMFKTVIKQCDHIKEKCESSVTNRPVTWNTIVKETEKLCQFAIEVKSFLYGQEKDDSIISNVNLTYDINTKKETGPKDMDQNESLWNNWNALYNELLENIENDVKLSELKGNDHVNKNTENTIASNKDE